MVFLPRGNDGVGVVGAFAIEAPPEQPLLLIKGTDTTDSIRAKTAGHRRIVVVPLMQDDDSRIASTSMLAAFADPAWREVGRHDRVLVFERNGPR